MADVFDNLLGQDKVAGFLRTTVGDQQITHAYLFLGKPGSGKTMAAYDLAAAIFCDKGGCGKCDSCIRVLRRTHPDVHYLAPEGASGYVVDQMRDIIHDVSLAPIRSNRKVYILDRADLLQGAPANALLKTLEEPPAGVVFMLLGRTREAMLPTVLSRCQVVPLRSIPPSEAAGMLSNETGVPRNKALIALASSSCSLVRARDFLLSPARHAVREQTMQVLDGLATADDLDVLDSARHLMDVLGQPLAEVKAAQQQELDASSDFLAKAALSTLEKRQKRELSAREKQGMGEFMAMVDSWLRDCLLVREGKTEQVVNVDYLDSVERACHCMDSAGAIRALRAVQSASGYITYNVAPQLVVENLLFSIREVLSCQMS